MADNTADAEPEASDNTFDLNSLSELSFGPDWADGKPSRSPDSKRYENGNDRRNRGKPPTSRQGSRDRRSGGRPQGEHAERRGQEHGSRSKRAHDRQRSARPSFVPTVKVDLYPQDEAFDALVRRLQASARTYQLFEIAHLLLEKPERFVVVVSPKAKHGDDTTAKPLLYFSVPDHLPFESEEQAVNHALRNHVDLFFNVEAVETDPPSGNFQMVNKCTVTGELLGPPNYHRYQEFVQQHFASRISGMSFDRFQSRIESSKEQEDIDAWLESMKKGARYTVKDRQEGEPESFETLEAARHFLLLHRKEKVVGSAESVRFAGRDIQAMPAGNIRRSVEAYVEQQKHFPLDSANNIRGRLRRHKFAVYKKGAKGVSYVCAVKRKFRDAQSVFTDSIRNLIEFIEKHPDVPASKLPKAYIGVDTERQKPEALKMKEPATDVATPPDDGTEAVEQRTTSEAPPAAPEQVEASTQATPKSELTEAEQQKLNQLMLDLRWLITEGYVTEYGDGRLFAPAPLPEPKKKDLTDSGTSTAEPAAEVDAIAPESDAASDQAG